MANHVLESKEQPIITARQLARSVVLLLFFCVLIFWSAGTLNWWEGWAYIIIGILGWTVLGRIHLAMVHPDLIQERASYDEKENVKAWDKWLVPFIAFIGPLATLLAAGFDHRFDWSADPALWVKLAALAAFTLSSGFGHWATISNRFFAAVVRIQTERGHEVVDSGPYRLVRHPAYAGALVVYIATPLLLGSWWAFIPAGLTIAGYILRTALEDRTLREELPGYEAYTQRTRYRLIPGIW